MNSAPQSRKFLDSRIPPWVSSPYSLISWWDMEQLAEFHVYSVGFLLGQLKSTFDAYLLETKKQTLPGWPWLSVRDKKEISKNLRTIRKQCERLDLKVALSCIEEGLYDLKQELVKLEVVGKIYDDLSVTIRREMENINFFYMPSKQTRFYHKNELFGYEVAAKFPSLEFDIVEAGNCFAMGRSTACVFHLMRIMEVGVQTFGRLLGVTLPEDKEWQAILNNIKTKINAEIEVRPKKNKDPEIVVWSQIHAHLGSVKLGWRNRVMHPHDKYTLDEAEDLIGHVKAFMKTLTKLPAPTIV
jgi:hypothetical protein